MKNQHQAPIYEGLVKLRRKRIVPLMFRVINGDAEMQSLLSFR